MAKIKAPNRDQFALQKLKLLKDGGMEVIHTIMVSDGSITAMENRVIQSPNVPHPALLDRIMKLTEYLMRSVGMYDFQTALMSDTLEKEERLAARQLKPVIEKFLTHRLSIAKVIGISLSGEAKNEGVIISGTYTTPTTTIAINSPRIIFDRDAFGFEQELKEKIDEIVDEAYEYTYEGKKAQASLLDKEDFEGNEQGEMFGEDGEGEKNEPPMGDPIVKHPSVENLKKNLGTKKEKPVAPPKKKAPVPAKKKPTKLSTQGKKKKK